MAERKGDTKETLLDELESIKGLLQDDDDIPILSEVIEAIEPVPQDRPRQTSLFQPPASTRAPAAKPRPASITRASGENPFLPEHIRARLHGNRPPPLVEELAANASAQPRTDTPAEGQVSRAMLIDEVIQACLPDIEARLRARLDALTDEQLQALIADDAAHTKG